MPEITVDSWEYRQLQLDAESWRLLNSSPHVANLIAEWLEWGQRRTFRETSSAVSAAAGKSFASMPTYAELRRRRWQSYSSPALSPEEIRVSVNASWSQFERENARPASDVAA
jgi:hypothetical protein